MKHEILLNAWKHAIVKVLVEIILADKIGDLIYA